METPFINHEHKVLVGFKCSSSLKSTLCSQADKLEITLSSYVENIVLTQEHKQNEIKKLSEQIKSFKEKISFYENPFLKDVFDFYKGKTVSYKNRTGETIHLTINDISDVFTVIINSFIKQK